MNREVLSMLRGRRDVGGIRVTATGARETPNCPCIERDNRNPRMFMECRRPRVAKIRCRTAFLFDTLITRG